VGAEGGQSRRGNSLTGHGHQAVDGTTAPGAEEADRVSGRGAKAGLREAAEESCAGLMPTSGASDRRREKNWKPTREIPRSYARKGVRYLFPNILERTFGESRRRTKVIPRFPTERSCLALVFASLITASAQWRDLCMTPRILRQLDALRPQQSLPTVSQAMANLGALRREGFYTEHWT